MAKTTPTTPTATTDGTKTTERIANIRPANMQTTTVRIRGTAPLVINAFSRTKVGGLMGGMSTPKADKRAKTARPPRNYEADFAGARHRCITGWDGIPAGGLRRAMIDACRTVDLVMTQAKMAVFVVADGLDAGDGTPLVRLYSLEPPEQTSMPVRNDNGSVDIRVRPMWREWWADVVLRYDADMISAESVINLLDRAGQQVGIGEGRHFSKKSTGMGWGSFVVEPQTKEQVA